MENSFLLNADPPALAQHFKASAARLGTKEVTKDLLAKIDNESLPSRIYVSWLSAGGDCEAIQQGIHFANSKTVRQASIAHFGKLFRTIRVDDVWNSIGGTAGVIEFLASASVCDVKSFCRQIGRSATAKISTPSRTAFVDELYKALRDIATPGAESSRSDQRPLSSLYNAIFPACSQDLILSAVDEKSGIEDVHNGEEAFFSHTALFRSRCISELRDPSFRVDAHRLRTLMDISSNDGPSRHDASLTANTEFVLEALEVLSSREKLNGDATAILSVKSTTLFRRLARRRCLLETLRRATMAYAAFTKKHISNKSSANLLHAGPAVCLIKHWGRCPDQLEDILVIYLRLVPDFKVLEASECLRLIRLVPISLRTRLLGLVSHHDLQTDHGLKKSRIQWDSQLLLALVPAEARLILQRLIEIGADGFVPSSLADHRQGELQWLMVKLSRGEPNFIDLATSAVEQQKKEAHQAREQPQRAARASTALRIAAASQSLDLYRQVLLWTRRYIKDPVTSMEIFRGTSFPSQDCLELLCGFPETQHECGVLHSDQVASNVRQANIIITECFQTACQAQKEPSFQSYHWNTVLGLMSSVVSKRYERVNVLQDVLKLLDDDVFEIVWHDTFETCMSLERSGLHKDNMSLGFNTLGGPLTRGDSTLPVLVNPRPATCRYLEIMAEARNEYWEQYRRKHVPTTMTLPDPYPRGLPLDFLVPVNFKQCVSGLANLPYLLSRAERIVFVPADLALAPQPTSDDDTSAIGAFVESWQSGLAKYINMSLNCREAALTAWKHVMGPLSTTRMSEMEAHLFWSRIFSDSIEDTELHGPWEAEPAQPPSPRIPHAEDKQPTEWSPGVNVKPFEIKSRRRLEPLIIDAMLNAHPSVDKTIGTPPYVDTYSEVPRRLQGSFWYRWMDRRDASPVVREALIAAAMLHVSEVNSLSPGILSTPFPPGKDVRFPALYLDGDFLDREDVQHSPHFLWGTMERRPIEFPATLLLRLARSLMDATLASEEQTPTHALKLLRILIKGDRPQMALSIIQELILDRPEDSSWQRLIITKGLMHSLPKQVAQLFLRDLSTAIQQRLSEGIKTSNEASTQQSPRIKITTVKLVSQLLSGATFIDRAFSSSVLIGILASTKHIDVRVSVLESLLDVLRESKDTTLCNDILAAFETHLIPVMSSMNERAPMSRDEWMACDSSSLPEVYGLLGDNLQPLLLCIISHIGKVSESMRRQLFDRILIPTLWESCKTNGRWVHLFLKSCGTSLSIDSLPQAPTQLLFLVQLMKWPAYIPASVLDLWLQILSLGLQPPPVIATTNRIVLKDSKLRNSSNGQHWLELWGAPAQKTLIGKTRPVSLLLQEWQSVRKDGLTIRHIQLVVIRQFNLIRPLYSPVSDHDPWKTFIGDFRPLAWTSRKLGMWHRNIKPLLQQVLVRVEALRTIEWQRNPDRSPAVLPDTFLWRVWLLTPALDSEDTCYDDLKLFASSVSELLAEHISSQRSYTEQYEAIASFIRENGTTKDWTTLALLFGDLNGLDFKHLNTVHDLRIDLARQLLEAGRDTPPPEETLRMKVVAMVRKLAACNDEKIRMIGLKLLRDRKHHKVWYAEVTKDQ